jgi:DNA invertase Pin-like site-specific DNA recombinase
MLRERVRAGMAQARRAGKRVGRPARRQFHQSDIERMKALRAKGTSVRKLASSFGTTQWMASRLTSSNASKDAVWTPNGERCRSSAKACEHSTQERSCTACMEAVGPARMAD